MILLNYNATIKVLNVQSQTLVKVKMFTLCDEQENNFDVAPLEIPDLAITESGNGFWKRHTEWSTKFIHVIFVK